MEGHNPELVQLLNALAFPTDQATYTQADNALQAGLKQPGVYGQLQAISATREFPKEVRLLSALLIGRELPKKWRAKAIVPDELKPEIRQRFFQFFDEGDYQIARAQLRTLVTIARQEYPRTWQSLPTDLLNPLTSSFAHISSHPTGDLQDQERNRQKVILLNSLWTWNAFVKEWRSVKLPVGQKLMAEFIHSLRTPMYQYLDFFMAREPVLEDWELWESARYCFKICARLAEWEFSRPADKRVDQDPSRITQLVTNSLGYLSTLQTIRLQLLSSPYYTVPSREHPAANTAPARMLKSLTKFIRVIGKTYEALMHIDPKTFVAIPGTVGAVGWWWSEVAGAAERDEMPEEDDETAKYPKRFLLLGLILFKNILPTLSVDHPEVFTDQFIADAFNLLIDHLLPMTDRDWEQWNEEPEEWLVESLDISQAWSYDFRPCAERVLMSLSSASRGRKVMEPLLLQKLEAVMALPKDTLNNLLKQDAVLCAAGRMSRALMDHIKLDQILSLLAPALASSNTEDRILKARAAWLIGQWVSSDEDAARLQVVWQVLLHLLTVRQDESSDMAVTISAAMALKECIDLWELEVSVFEPYIGQIARDLLKAIDTAVTLPGKRAILECLTILIDRVRDKIMPYLPDISAAIPQLWAGSVDLDGEWLFKASLVVMASKLVVAAGSQTSHILHLIVPLIEESLTGPAKEHFEEDGMVLWQVALRAVPSLPLNDQTGLAKLFPGLLGLLAENLDVLRTTVSLMESYMILAGEDLMQAYGEQVIRAYAAALNQVPKESTRILLESLDVVLQVSSPSTWISHFVNTGLAQKACDIIDDPKTGGPELAAYDTLLARVVLREPTAFATFVNAYAQTQVTANAVAKQLELTIDAMWRAYEYVGDAKRRKMVAMAFANLLLLGEGAVFEHMEGEFANAWLDTLGEIKENPDAGNEIVRNWQDSQGLLASDLEGTEEYNRRNALSAVDPVFSQTLKAYIAERLTRAQDLGMRPYWDRLDQGIKDSLTKFLS